MSQLMRDMANSIMENGSGIVVSPPCARVCGYTEDDLLEGVVLMGSKAIHDQIKQGAAVLTF